MACCRSIDFLSHSLVRLYDRPDCLELLLHTQSGVEAEMAESRGKMVHLLPPLQSFERHQVHRKGSELLRKMKRARWGDIYGRR